MDTNDKNFLADETRIFQPENPLPPAELENLPISLQKACEKAGWHAITPVQSLALPYLLAKHDIMIQSRTGSGKTGCYLLPMLENLEPENKCPQALVLAPTRELVKQVENEAEILFADSGLAVCGIYGGTNFKKQIRAIENGAQVIIGSPGRVLDHLLRNSLDFKNLHFLALDEADRMLSIGFYPDMVEIARYLPKNRHTALFSATYPPHVLRLAEEFMRQPEFLSLSRKEVHVAEVEHLYCQIKPMDRDRALIRLLETQSPSSAIIFCNTKADAHYVTGVLTGFGYSADELSSDLTQKKREEVLEKIRQGKLQYLAATDVAARGLDIPDLSHVFLYGPPEDPEGYIHRAGRTGRAGATGTVITLVDIMQKLELERLANRYNIELREIAAPSDEDVARIAGEKLNAILESRLRSLSGLERIRISRYLPLARELAGDCDGEENSSMDILAMLLDDFHRQSLNESRFPLRRKSSNGRVQSRRTKKRGYGGRHRDVRVEI